MPVKPVKVTEMIKEETQKRYPLVLLPFKSHLRMNILCIMQEFEIKRKNKDIYPHKVNFL